MQVPGGGYYAPVQEYSGEAFPAPKWVTHCQHAKYVNVLSVSCLFVFISYISYMLELP